MSTYIIGDIHGCYNELRQLLKKIKFNKNNDTVIFSGDLINRGGNSLKVLKFIKDLESSSIIILGNHELYLLSLSYNILPVDYNNNDLKSILYYSKKAELIEWLRQQKIIYEINNHIITHAGVPFIWSINQAHRLAKELENVLKNDILCYQFLSQLMKTKNTKFYMWNENLKNIDRWICITKYFTEMRLCNKDGELYFNYNNRVHQRIGYKPWFYFNNTFLNNKYKIVFGHWSELNGITNKTEYINLDTGCVWGGKLTAYCIETKKCFSVSHK